MILIGVVVDLDHVGKAGGDVPFQAGMSVRVKIMILVRIVGDLDHVGKGGDEPCQTGR